MSAADPTDPTGPSDTAIPRQAAQGQPSAFKSLTASVANALQRDIVSGRYRPGEKLPIVKLAKSYGVSPGAVREALSRLISEGLVEFNEQRGFRAAPVSQASLMDIARTRVMIDAHALREAVRLGDIDWEADVLAMQHRLANCPLRDAASAGVRDEWQRLHRVFHRTLIAACGSEWLMRFHDLLFDQAVRYRSLASTYALDLRRDVGAEHAEIVDAVIARDGDAAAAAIEKHYMLTATLLAEVPGAVSPAEPPRR
jgi:DNA-binding GntR family transcriptional regulator